MNVPAAACQVAVADSGEYGAEAKSARKRRAAGLGTRPPFSRAALERWFDAGIRRLHCLPWDADTGLKWAELLARLRTTGKAMPIKDSPIAATAAVYNLTVATRNHADFVNAGVRIIDPFVSGG